MQGRCQSRGSAGYVATSAGWIRFLRPPPMRSCRKF